MTHPHNIERSAFRKGEYVGYAAGSVWRVKRAGKGWQATSRDASPRVVFGQTLASISKQLEAFKARDALPNPFVEA